VCAEFGDATRAEWSHRILRGVVGSPEEWAWTAAHGIGGDNWMTTG
jgi:hypothetical protein